MVNAGQLMERQPSIAGFAVVKMHEAMALMDAGVSKPVLLMGPFDEKNLEDAGRSRHHADGLHAHRSDARSHRYRPAQAPPLHICVDTGIGRVGVPFQQAPALVRDLAARNRCVSKA